MRRGVQVAWARIGLAAITTLLIAAGLAPSHLAHAQAPAKLFRLGILGVQPNTKVNRDSLLQGLSEAGYIEGRDFVVVDRQADGAEDQLPALATRLVREKPDVIFARAPAAVVAASRATTAIPIVAVDLESDPVAMGFVKTLGRPGGNVTGVFMDLPEMSAKQLQLLREMLPGLARVTLVGDSTAHAAQFRATGRAAQEVGVQVQVTHARTLAEIEAGLEAARRGGSGAALVFSSPVVFANAARLATVAREKRLPMVSLFSASADAGGLLSYGPNLPHAFRRCGVYVSKILGGTKPSDLPIERPDRFELVINVKTARILGLTIPPSLMARADRLVE